MPTPEEQFTAALNDVRETLENVNLNLVNVLSAVSVEPIAEDNVPNRAVITDALGNVTTSPITSTELGYLDGATSNIQTQLDNKLAKKSAYTNGVLVTDSSGNIVTHSTVGVNELGMLDGTTSNVQTQLNAKQEERYFSTDGKARKLIQTVSTGTTELYAKLCTWTTTQDGQKLMIKGAGSSGFNAYSIQQFELAVNVNTSNGYDDGAGQGYFSGQCYMHDMQNHRNNVRVYLIQPSSTVCEVWVKLPEYCTMVYEILASANNEVDVTPEYQATAPTSDTKYIYSPQALAKLNGWTASKVVVTDASGNLIANPNVSWTEVNMLKGVKSNIQTQIDDKQTQLTSINNKVNGNTLIGEIKWVAHNNTISGWLLCDGRAVSRASYPSLFSVIGTTWGEGDGSTTFNLPNLIDKTVWGGSTAGGYKEAGLPDHDHSYSSFPRHGEDALEGLSTARWSDGIHGTDTAKVTGTSTKASASNSIYGKSTTVQPPAAVLRPVIKY